MAIDRMTPRLRDVLVDVRRRLHERQDSPMQLRQDPLGRSVTDAERKTGTQRAPAQITAPQDGFDAATRPAPRLRAPTSEPTPEAKALASSSAPLADTWAALEAGTATSEQVLDAGKSIRTLIAINNRALSESGVPLVTPEELKLLIDSQQNDFPAQKAKAIAELLAVIRGQTPVESSPAWELRDFSVLGETVPSVIGEIQRLIAADTRVLAGYGWDEPATRTAESVQLSTLRSLASVLASGDLADIAKALAEASAIELGSTGNALVQSLRGNVDAVHW